MIAVKYADLKQIVIMKYIMRAWHRPVYCLMYPTSRHIYYF